MRVIITGGSGLIGRALTAELTGASHEVVILSCNPQRSASQSPNISIEKWDGQAAQGWAHLADGALARVFL